MRFQDLLAYKKSFELAMSIFGVSKNFPIEEKYSLTDQIRRSSRSVSVNMPKPQEKEDMLIILFPNLQIVMPKILKPNLGWNMHLRANI